MYDDNICILCKENFYLSSGRCEECLFPNMVKDNICYVADNVFVDELSSSTDIIELQSYT